MESSAQPGFSQWKALLEREHGEKSSSPTPRLSALMRTCMALGHADPASMDYSRLDPQRCSALALASSLRCVCSIKDLVPTWEMGLLMAIDAAAREGIDARSLLSGLL